MDETGLMRQKSADVVAASFQIYRLMAIQKQSHTIAKFHILPGAKILVKGGSLPSPGLVR